MTARPDGALTAFLKKYPPEIGALALAARAAVLAAVPGAGERVDAKMSIIGYGLGPGYKGLICTLIVSESGVKLGLIRGAELGDPRGLLEGSGKVHQYIQLRQPGDLAKPGVKPLVKAAYAAWKTRQSSIHSRRESTAGRSARRGLP